MENTFSNASPASGTWQLIRLSLLAVFLVSAGLGLLISG